MGLDIDLYQFKKKQVEAILKLACLADPARMPEKVDIKMEARKLGLPETIVGEPGFGGTRISFPSTKYSEWLIGEWHSFGQIRAILRNFFGKDWYFVFPEAKGIHGLFRPDWRQTRNRLIQILQELKETSPATWQEVYPFATRDDALKPLEVMIETLDFVLNSDNPREFLLYWSE
jgi:hypothetical protein